ncbi:hypothetical protein SAMN05421846_1189 [Chryseobacterium taeanense]|uniref:Tetratricopeptide repeat-containing protein n=1 Tax=Chryseobacterium taeanense TaxID=311334 RepID=A0A1G8P989_9FLAO|nr:hypothetical protein [Chryseobacterium taeanense]SDI88967.1 hypothetical protein SAMN05421846_1189 [Chryseobacterium taeanense]
MKKTLLICFCVVGFCLQAQTFSEKDFKQTVSQLNTAKTESDYENAFQKFSKFTSTKTTDRWEAYYYAATATYMEAELQLQKNPSIDVSNLSGLAKKYADGGYSDSKQNNAETDILLGLIAFQKTQGTGVKDVQNNLDIVSQMIARAEAVSPDNPRLAILKAKLEERSGNKENAEKLFKKALTGLGIKSNASAPTWGRQLIPSMN